ncbi:MAG: putative membrane protein [Cellvibrionaceae bacterium]|jgi:putative membrane protein
MKNDHSGKPYRSSDWLLLFLKGMTMGAADIVPGVSGGTIAFISGIYDRLLNALKSLTPMALVTLFREGFGAFWQATDGRFLVTLFAGILLSVVTLANFIDQALKTYPILVWAFFFGLVIASIIYLIMQVRHWRWQELVALLLGTAFALIIVSLRPAQLPAQWWMLFISGSIAICAMILPGISGSFILLLLGMYKVFIEALNSLDIILLASFAAGCVSGLLGFSHLLSWLLKRYQTVMYTLLTGFLVGSLKVLWPWKQVLKTTLDRHGEQIPLVQINVWPTTYTQVTNEPAFLWPAILVAILGLALVLLLERIGDN